MNTTVNFKIRIQTFVLLLFLIVPGWVYAQELTVFCTNDLHGHLLKEKRDHIIDVSYAAALKHSEKNSLLLDAGDMAYGMAVTSEKPEFITGLAALLNTVGYDAMTLGNHEFDYGVSILEQRVKASAFPYLSANVTLRADSTQNYLKQFASSSVAHGSSFVKDVGGLKVGIFGLTTSRAASQTTNTLIISNRYADFVRQEIASLKQQGASVIIAITHIGTPEASDKLLDIEGLDIVVDGHSHEEYITYKKDSTKLIIQTGTEARKIGKIKRNSQNGKLKAELLTYDDVLSVPPYMPAVEQMNELQKKVDADYGDTNYELKEPLWGGGVDYSYKGEKYTVEPLRLTQTMLGKLWAYIMLDKWNDNAGSVSTLKAEKTRNAAPLSTDEYIILKNGGSFRAGLPAGKVNGEDIYRMVPNNSKVLVVHVTQKTLAKILKKGLETVGRNTNGFRYNIKNSRPGSFLQWQGISGEYNTESKEADFEFAYSTSYDFNLEPNNDTEKFTLITTDYVLGDTLSYGNIEYKEIRDLGNEQEIIRDFFNHYVEPTSFPLLESLSYFQDINNLKLTGESCPEVNNQTVELSYNDVKAANRDVRYVVYGSGDVEEYIGSTDENGRFIVPGELFPESIIEVECDIEVNVPGGKAYVTVHGSTYIDPVLGNGNQFVARIALKR